MRMIEYDKRIIVQGHRVHINGWRINVQGHRVHIIVEEKALSIRVVVSEYDR